MAETRKMDFVGKNQANLLKVAKAANILAWILFGAYLFIAGENIYFFYAPNLLKTIRENPLGLLSLLNPAMDILRAVLWWVILHGIALGLRTIVEIDRNFRMNYRDNLHDQ